MKPNPFPVPYVCLDCGGDAFKSGIDVSQSRDIEGGVVCHDCWDKSHGDLIIGAFKASIFDDGSEEAARYPDDVSEGYRYGINIYFQDPEKMWMPNHDNEQGWTLIKCKTLDGNRAKATAWAEVYIASLVKP